MKYIIIFLSISSLSCCNNNETIISNRNKEWYIETIEGHDFLYRDVGRSVSYIHRPNCNACKTIQTEIIDTNITY